MKYSIILALLMIQTASAENWLCSEEASQRSSNIVKSCGIGLGFDENGARVQSLDRANAEFSKVCKSSDDCNGHVVTSAPGRTSCEISDGGLYKCYRMMVYTITPAMKPQQAQAQTAPKAKKPTPNQCSKILLRGGSSVDSYEKYNDCMDLALAFDDT